ncbi:MAG: hypothetical protein HY718_15410 [Planctomycetes bacterium]|nr:hypothetical protein [Planctomycetota bacterium]
MRAATTSREPGLRLLLATVGWLLSNVWVWLKAQVVAQTLRPHRAATRRWLDAHFRLDAFRDLLIEAIKARYHVRIHLPCPFPLASPLKL